MSAKPARVRRFADRETGLIQEFEDLDAATRTTPYNFPGGFSAVSNRTGLAILSKESGLTPSDRDVLALHVHGPERCGDVLRWSRQAMADYLGITARTVASAIKKLTKGGWIFEAERHGRTIYYRATPHHASRSGGKQQQEDATAYRLPVAPGISQQKGRTA
ncbi:winged helix-turn-helix domain-containing protein [Streptomyces sp. NPDC091371]|uniref:winged helix-turn-helix domain-containing protein n=1 Tax=Streptomyces sp. NPDC091371 TaxID=3155303 RepID=UPI0034465C81